LREEFGIALEWLAFFRKIPLIWRRPRREQEKAAENGVFGL